MTINRFYDNFLKSRGDPQYNLVLLGVWTVDFKNRLKFLTDEPENSEFHRLVLRGTSHIRPRPDNSERFGSGSLIATFDQRNVAGFDAKEMNWLGETWKKEYNGYKLPSMVQIADGLITEANLQLELAMGKVSTQKSVLVAQANITKTWQNLFALSKIKDPNKPL